MSLLEWFFHRRFSYADLVGLFLAVALYGRLRAGGLSIVSSAAVCTAWMILVAVMVISVERWLHRRHHEAERDGRLRS